MSIKEKIQETIVSSNATTEKGKIQLANRIYKIVKEYYAAENTKASRGGLGRDITTTTARKDEAKSKGHSVMSPATSSKLDDLRGNKPESE